MQSILSDGYPILFNAECYEYLAATLVPIRYSGIFIIADTNTSQHCLPQFLSVLVTELPIEIIEIEAGEASKSIETCIEVWHALTDLGADRKSIIINIGGGVVTDLGRFIAATFKRGVDFINVPTSLLAMVDASVGGKTGVDLGVLKNQVGVICNPVAVLADVEFLETLPAEHMRSGLAEMLKHGLIADRDYWELFSDLNSLTTEDMTALIHHSVEIKNNIVKLDPKEKGLRKILNFGHTLGHAIESHFLDHPERETLLHGEAVAAGMVMEAFLSMQINSLDIADYITIKSTLKGIFGTTAFSDEDIVAIIQLLVHDKKNESGNILFVLLDGIGNATANHIIGNSLIYNAFEEYQN